MRSVATAPSVVPNHDVVHLVLDDLGKLGRVWRETPEEWVDFGTLVEDILSCQYSNPIRIVAFNLNEGWIRDVTREVAEEVKRRLPSGNNWDCAWQFVEHAGLAPVEYQDGR